MSDLILTEEELKDLEENTLEKNYLAMNDALQSVINSHRQLLSSNAELSFKNGKLTEELKSAKEMLVQSEVRRMKESGLLK